MPKTQQPLAHKRIAVTRSETQASELSKRLQSLGAEVLELPLIQIKAEVAPEQLSDVFGTLATYEWIVFTSPNGVQHFMKLFLKGFEDIRAIGPARFACIGKGTASELEAYHFKVDLIPEQAVAESLAKALIETDSLDSANVLVVTGSRNRDILVTLLEQKGRAIVDTLQVYSTHYTNLSKNEVARQFRERGADAITFTSSSTAESFAAQAKNLILAEGTARHPKTVSMGPITSQTMKSKGIPVHCEAKESSLDGLIASIVELLT